MSMPSFPPHGANMTREQALTMIIASVAMEESALSRIIDAEGDKLRYILDRCGVTVDCSGVPEEILEVNRSVTELLDVVAQNQTILRGKLALALSADGECPPDPPCPPPCPSPCPPPCSPIPPCPELPQKSLMQLRLSGSGFLWKKKCLIPWEYLGGRGNAVRWSWENPSMVELDPGKTYSVSCMFTIRDFLPTATSGHICLEGSDASRELLPLCFCACCAGGEAVTLQYSTLLLPGSTSSISFRLCSRPPLWVEQAELNIAEL